MSQPRAITWEVYGPQLVAELGRRLRENAGTRTSWCRRTDCDLQSLLWHLEVKRQWWCRDCGWVPLEQLHCSWRTRPRATSQPIHTLCVECAAARARAVADARETRTGRLWTPDEDARLHKWIGRLDPGEMAQRLRRTRWGVVLRLRRLRLAVRPGSESWWTVADLAELLEVGPQVVYAWVRRMGCPAHTVSGVLVIQGGVLLRWWTTTRPEAFDWLELDLETWLLLHSGPAPVAEQEWADRPEPPSFKICKCPICGRYTVAGLYDRVPRCAWCPRHQRIPSAARAYTDDWPDPPEGARDGALLSLDTHPLSEGWPLHGDEA